MNNQDKKKILLVDDDTSLLITLSDFLRFEGYDIVTADSGERALEVLQTIKPDLIILDMSMPGMGGIGFLREISGTDGKCRYPVLVLTARANMAEFFANVDVDGFIAKPCNPSDLLMEVGRIIFLTSGEIAADAHSPTPVTPSKILIGEDDANHNRALVQTFQRHGFTVESVTKGPDVLEKAIIGKPDIILMKVLLASMNGDAVASMLSEMPNTRDIPVVLYDDSNLREYDQHVQNRNSQIRKVIPGASPEILLDAVRKILE